VPVQSDRRTGADQHGALSAVGQKRTSNAYYAFTPFPAKASDGQIAQTRRV
jgi:hypothetical protein